MFEAAQRSQLDAAQRMGCRDATLEPDDMEEPAGEIDLAPFEPAKLTDAQAVPVGDEDHRGIAMAVATALASRGDQRLDLDRRSMLRRRRGGRDGSPAGRNWTVPFLTIGLLLPRPYGARICAPQISALYPNHNRNGIV